MLFVFLAELYFVLFTNPSLQEKKDFLNKQIKLHFPNGENVKTTTPLFANTIAHPFWGHTFNPHFYGNNYGFEMKENFPITRKNNEFQVGLFGASVAARLSHYFYFKNENIQVTICGVQKSIKLTNYAMPGFKQPQQFNVFHNFIESIDMAINIDGNNDITFDVGEELPVQYPIFYKTMFMLTDKKIKTLNNQYNIKKIEYEVLTFFSTNSWLLTSNTVYKLIFKFILYIDSWNKALGIDLVLDQHGIYAKNETRVLEKIKIWSKYVKLQDQISKANGIKSVFIAQPTQYLPDSKILTENEKNIAIVKNSESANYKTKIFQMFRSELKLLSQQGYAIYDLLSLYSQIENEIFVDDMCHVNQLGYQILYEKVVSIIKTEIKSMKCPNQ